jgi:hypothetical protein
MNQVVARFNDGRILKGQTNDFLPAKDRFHLAVDGTAPGTKPLEVAVPDLKALFFVKTLEGHPEHQKINDFEHGKLAPGRKVIVRFKDGETLAGTTQGYQPNRPGFFLIPADGDSNNERCFVITASAKDVQLL